VLIVRPESLASYPELLHLESSIFGTFDAPVRVTDRLRESVDVLWVTCKATHLKEAIRSAPPETIGHALIVPLLNGLDHIAMLREHYGQSAVVPAEIRADATRVAPDHIVHNGWTVVVRPELIHTMTPAAAVQLSTAGPR